MDGNKVNVISFKSFSLIILWNPQIINPGRLSAPAVFGANYLKEILILLFSENDLVFKYTE
jgi:hypothetical protein